MAQFNCSTAEVFINIAAALSFQNRNLMAYLVRETSGISWLTKNVTLSFSIIKVEISRLILTKEALIFKSVFFLGRLIFLMFYLHPRSFANVLLLRDKL